MSGNILNLKQLEDGKLLEDTKLKSDLKMRIDVNPLAKSWKLQRFRSSWQKIKILSTEGC